MNRIALFTALLTLGSAPPRPAAPTELRELVISTEASPAELRATARRLGVAQLRAAILRQHVIQDELDAVDQVQRALDLDHTVELMPHEMVRLRAERSVLTNQQEAAADEALALRARLGPDAVDDADRPWPPRRALDVAALSQSAQRRAIPGAREAAAARVQAEISRVAHAEHRIDDINESVLPDVTEALTSALVDLPDGATMLEVVEALERQAAVRNQVIDAELDRELALARLELLSGEPTAAPRRSLEPGRVGSL